MKYDLRIDLDDNDGGSWDENESFEAATEDEALDAAIELVQEALGPRFKMNGDPASLRAVKGQGQLSCLGSYIATVDVSGDDVSIWS